MLDSAEELRYAVVGGVVVKCTASTVDGQTHIYASDGDYIAANAGEDEGPSDLGAYVFESMEEAQRAILNGTVVPGKLCWKATRAAEHPVKPKIYIAGTHVFRPDAVEYGRKLREQCARFGFEGLYPYDKEPIDNLSKRDKATMIFFANEGLIRRADIVIADLNPFRGHEPDSGTVFECGTGYALGKKLYGFISDGRTMREKLGDAVDKASGLYTDGMTVEDFDLPLNLMLSVPMKIVVGEFEQCLERLSLELNLS